jgi:3-phosphoshikimate 1-carboxyvinyltransferase
VIPSGYPSVGTTDDSAALAALHSPVVPARIECYADHRIAMCFGVLGLAAPGVTITDPACTKKTYPDFWEDLRRVRGLE